ncbi:hypothetical protein ACA910_006018 [Epithemia clementina (nom. ined.)]
MNTNTPFSTIGWFREIHSHAIPWKNNAYDNANTWMESVEYLLEHARTAAPGLDNHSLEHVKAICVSGTSASCLLVDGKNVGRPSRSPSRMYNYNVISSETAKVKDPIHGVRALEQIDKFAPQDHTARSATGTLAKLLSWHDEKPLRQGERLCHQSDYITLRLLSDDKACGSRRNERFVYSDWHNCLKLGYDVRQLEWPPWLIDCLESVGLSAEHVLPTKVVSPGEALGTISMNVARRLGLPETTLIVGGTTDSNAAFIAATAGGVATDTFSSFMAEVEPGTAVVSLGSTLAMKQISETYVENARYGVYSHRYPSTLPRVDNDKKGNDPVVKEDEAWWLVGGASNVGCAILRQEGFGVDELNELSAQIDPSIESPLSYYPLTSKGERFPIANGDMEPQLEPKPLNRRDYLHGILQGISTVENDGFALLGKLGATPKVPNKVWTCGGGAQNKMWTQMRQRRLREALLGKGNDHVTSSSTSTCSIEVLEAENTEASYGAALLAAAHALQKP